MTIEQQIARMFAADKQRPDCELLMSELAQIKQQLASIMEALEHPVTYPRYNHEEQEYFRFVQRLRMRLGALAQEGLSVSIFYQDRTLGIDANGYLYDKATAYNLPTHLAFEVYRFLYDHRKEIDRYTDPHFDLDFEPRQMAG